MALGATEQKELRAMIVEMVAKGLPEDFIERCWRSGVAHFEKLKVASAKPPSPPK